MAEKSAIDKLLDDIRESLNVSKEELATKAREKNYNFDEPVQRERVLLEMADSLRSSIDLYEKQDYLSIGQATDFLIRWNISAEVYFIAEKMHQEMGR
jgi:hypothetical protein